MKNVKLMQLVSMLVLCSLILGCTPDEQEQIISLLDQAQKTVVSEAQTQSVPLQTQAAEALRTKIAEGGEFAKTAIAEGGDAAKTQVAVVGQTAAARAATEAANIISTRAPVPTQTPTPVQPQEIDYFALGDSIASGHGLQSAKGDSEDGICKRSTYAYPYMLKKTLEDNGYTVNLHHLACTGATAGIPKNAEYSKDPVKLRYKWLRNQAIDAESLIRDDHLTLVTISIGANDIGWTRPMNMAWHLWMLPEEFTTWTDGIKKEVRNELNDVLVSPYYGLLTGHPNVYIVINDLYNPVNPESFLFNLRVTCAINADRELECKPGLQTGGLKVPCTDYLTTFECWDKADFIITEVGNTIGGVWDTIRRDPTVNRRIWYANVNAAFTHHESARGGCGTGGPSEADSWIQYIGYPQSNEGIDFLNITKGDCFHPNIEGSKQISNVVAKRLKIMGFSLP